MLSDRRTPSGAWAARRDAGRRRSRPASAARRRRGSRRRFAQRAERRACAGKRPGGARYGAGGESQASWAAWTVRRIGQQSQLRWRCDEVAGWLRLGPLVGRHESRALDEVADAGAPEGRRERVVDARDAERPRRGWKLSLGAGRGRRFRPGVAARAQPESRRGGVRGSFLRRRPGAETAIIVGGEQFSSLDSRQEGDSRPAPSSVARWGFLATMGNDVGASTGLANRVGRSVARPQRFPQRDQRGRRLAIGGRQQRSPSP
ncbi:hypothetical protein SAMN02745121_04473 [Nannocystis exedens]|uniref:Uncharacterized protein n=1 Tax=Nannocystis exedens TaxID=54 RepID=A0A1I2B1U5_9BACT|nr:hypothetical protein NAEX_07465 [Nannocystis exedens]SFE49233.1 hypothetical protein SAMN02745121_04473 [Nannocystis exedens]